MTRLPIRVSFSALLSLSLIFVSTSVVAAERPTNLAQLLLWLLSMNNQGEQTERPKIDVNSATAETLTAVPGLDRRQALRIIANRPYATLQDLVRSGLSTRFIERLAGLLTVDSKVVERLSAEPSSGTPPAGKAATPAR
jgi:DNA uptake protein ComE-like DNA-binding protein